MNKKITGIIVPVVVFVIAAAVIFFRGGGESYVTSNDDGTLTFDIAEATDDNAVDSASTISVGSDEHVHIDYDLSEGSMDVQFEPTFRDSDEDQALITINDDREYFGQNDISGSGSLDFEALPQMYDVTFYFHNAKGTGEVSVINYTSYR